MIGKLEKKGIHIYSIHFLSMKTLLICMSFSLRSRTQVLLFHWLIQKIETTRSYKFCYWFELVCMQWQACLYVSSNLHVIFTLLFYWLECVSTYGPRLYFRWRKNFYPKKKKKRWRKNDAYMALNLEFKNLYPKKKIYIYIYMKKIMV